MIEHSNCPHCNENWDGEEIPYALMARRDMTCEEAEQEAHEFFGWTPENKMCFKINMVAVECGRDRVDHFRCLSCYTCFDRDGEQMLGHDQKVEATVANLKELGVGARVRVSRRQLAHREKTYLKIRADGTHDTYKSLVMPVIRKYFPDAYMTSGGFGPAWADASEPYMNITVALEK